MDTTEKMIKSINDLNKAHAEAMKRLDDKIKQVQENRRKQTGEQSQTQ